MLANRISLFSAVALTLSILGSAAIVSTSAHAQDDVRKRGDKACKTSTNQLCSKHFGQGDMAILGCLQHNKGRLTGSCRKFLVDIGQLQ